MPKSKRKSAKPKAKSKAQAKTKAKTKAKAKGARKLTPVLYVHQIEPCLSLWVDRLGFSKTVEVPEGNAIGFVILKKGDVEVMYQTMASVANDVPALGSRMPGQTHLYVEVDDINAIEQAVQGSPVVVPRRQTFYGATEIGVKDAGGNVILFSQMGAQ